MDMPNTKISFTAPKIFCSQNFWHFTDMFCEHYDSEYRFSIANLSNALRVLPVNRWIPTDPEGNKTIEVLHCFSPDEVNELNAAILCGDEEAFDKILSQVHILELLDEELTVTDRSWVLISDRKVISKELRSLDNGLSYKIKPFFLTMLCKQHNMTKKLLQMYEGQLLPAIKFNDMTFIEVLMLTQSPYIDQYFATHQVELMQAYLKVGIFSSPFEIGIMDRRLATHRCTLSIQEVDNLLSVAYSTVNERSGTTLLYTNIIKWLVVSEFDLNQRLNENGESLIFLLFAAKRYKCIRYLLAKAAKINHGLRNAEGKTWFETMTFADIETYDSASDYYEIDPHGFNGRHCGLRQLLHEIFNNNDAKLALPSCAFMQNDSEILNELLRYFASNCQREWLELAEKLYEINPNLQLTKGGWLQTSYVSDVFIGGVGRAPANSKLLIEGALPIIKAEKPSIYIKITLHRPQLRTGDMLADDAYVSFILQNNCKDLLLQLNHALYDAESEVRRKAPPLPPEPPKVESKPAATEKPAGNPILNMLRRLSVPTSVPRFPVRPQPADDEPSADKLKPLLS
jgi:hypothetical protein